MSFTSSLNDQLVGFYRSTYIDEASGEERLLAVTQFETTDARRAFPCLDEPNMKAIFNVALGHPDNLIARSNTEPLGAPEPIADLPGYSMTKFEPSPIMSTYLVAFLISDFTFTQSTDDPSFKVTLSHFSCLH